MAKQILINISIVPEYGLGIAYPQSNRNIKKIKIIKKLLLHIEPNLNITYRYVLILASLLGFINWFLKFYINAETN